MFRAVAKIEIAVNELMQLDVVFNGDKRYSMLLLGAIDLAKEVVTEQIPLSVSSQYNASPTKEVQMNKEETLSVYLKARKVIEKRIQAINQAAGDQKFIIDKGFISTLGIDDIERTGQ